MVEDKLLKKGQLYSTRAKKKHFNKKCTVKKTTIVNNFPREEPLSYPILTTEI